MAMQQYSASHGAPSHRPCVDAEPPNVKHPDRPLVSVIVPCYNAERTIDETLASVRAQTYPEIEILVVDDGSTDGSVSRIERHVSADTRVRLFRQTNSGVASARNRGIAHAAGEYVAPLDADDLWHPRKIERQVAMMMEGGPDMALVFTRYAVIDESGRLIHENMGNPPASPEFMGLCRRNFIGNGSSALMRRDVVVAVGGYDSSLRGRGAQGCEDLMLYLQIAEKHKIGLVPEPLTGYRQFLLSMSADGRQMVKSFDLVAESFCNRRPELRSAFDEHRVFMLRWLASRAASAKRWRVALRFIWEAICGAPHLAFDTVVSGVGHVLQWPLRRLTRYVPWFRRQRYID